MNIAVTEESPEILGDYARIPMCLEVCEIFQVSTIDYGPGGFTLLKRPVQAPYLKDYDALENPQQWPGSFDLSNLGK